MKLLLIALCLLPITCWGQVNVSSTVPAVSFTVNTRAASLNTSYQPSTTRDALVVAVCHIATVAAGDGKIELLSDSSNPPTTVISMFRVGTALNTTDTEVSGIVKAGNYYQLKSTNIVGTNTFSITGNVQENLQ